MASLTYVNKRATVQFMGQDGKRRSIRLGACDKRQAETAKLHIENLVACKHTGSSINGATAEWIAGLPDLIRERIENVGLIEPLERKRCPTVKEWFNEYIGIRQDVKPGTRIAFDQARQKFIAYVGEGRRLDDVTAWDAEAFKAHLKTLKLSEAYARRLCRSTKQFFHAAIKQKFLTENPFAGVRCGNHTNKTRYHFVTHEEAMRVLAACPNNEWRLIFSLARFGGLRIPSELLALQWSDVDWEQERLTIRASKTEHHEDGGVRQIPLFPEIKSYLLKQFDKALPGEDFIIVRYRQTNVNLRTQLERIISRAGLVAWPKLFQNCRSSRETELARQFPLHVVTSWLGNTPKVAQDHYLQTTDSDFQKALESPCSALQKAVQYTQEMDSTETEAKIEECRKSMENEGIRSKAPVYENDEKTTNGRGWIRTIEDLRQWVYSPSPLATRAHAHPCAIASSHR